MPSSPDAMPDATQDGSTDGSPDDQRPIDPNAVARAVDRLAALPQPPWLHAEVARRMAERLAIIKLQPNRLIDWSGFLGAGIDSLAAAYPKAERMVVEPTATLAERSRSAAKAAQGPWWSTRRYVGQGTEVVTGEPGVPAQLIWSNMALHAVRDPPGLFDRWQRALSADGFVMFSCLGPGTLIELRQLYRRLGWGAPMSEFVDMHDLGDMMVRAGFADPVMDQETITLTWETPAALLAELRSIGLNASPERFAGCRTPRWKERLSAELRALDSRGDRIGLSFEIAYGHAFKGAPRRKQGEPTHVSLDDMRSLVRKAAQEGGHP